MIVPTFGFITISMVIAAWWLWHPQPNVAPWYRPGDIRNQFIHLRNSLLPPSQEFHTLRRKEWNWHIARDVRLHGYTTYTPYCANQKACPYKDIITVLVIHGGPGVPPPEPWKALDILQEQSKRDDTYIYNYRFIYYHQRGSGKSTRFLDKFEETKYNNYKKNVRSLVEVYGLQEQVADIIRIKELLESEGSLCFQNYKLLVVGHSFGGFLATLFAAEYPDYVKGLVLVEPANMISFPNEREEIFLTVRKKLDKEDAALFDEWRKEYFDFTPSLFMKSETELAKLHAQFFDFWRKAAQMDIPTPPLQMIGGWMVYGIKLSLGLSHNYSSVLSEIKTPVLLIHGGKDLVSLQNVLDFQSLLRYAELEIIEDAGHFPFNESPKSFAYLLSKFLTSLEEEEEEEELDEDEDEEDDYSYLGN